MQPWQPEETRSRPLQERASKLPWPGTDPEREDHLLKPFEAGTVLRVGQESGWEGVFLLASISLPLASLSPGIPFS